MRRSVRHLLIRSCASLLLAVMLLCDPALTVFAGEPSSDERLIAEYTLEDAADRESADEIATSEGDDVTRHYDELSDDEKSIYEFLYDNADDFITHSYDEEEIRYDLYRGENRSVDCIEDDADEAFTKTVNAIRAFSADHREVYWLDFDKFSFGISAVCAADDEENEVYDSMWLTFGRRDDDTFLYDRFSMGSEEEARAVIEAYETEKAIDEAEETEDGAQEAEDGVIEGLEEAEDTEAVNEEDDRLLDEDFEVVVHGFFSNKIKVGRGYSVDYDIVPASMEDSVNVRVTSSNNSVAAVGWEESNYNMVFPQKYGSVTLTVTATDKEDATKTASAQTVVTCVYPTEEFFDFYGTRFAFSESELFSDGWLTKEGSTFTRGRNQGKNRTIYYFKDGRPFPNTVEDKAYPVIEESGAKYLFDIESRKLIKEWIPLTGIEIADIPVEATGIDTNTLSYGSSYTLTATLTPKYANDSYDAEWTSLDPSTVKVTSLGCNADKGEIYARIDVLRASATPVTVKLEAGESINRKVDTIEIYARYPVGWHKIDGKIYYGEVKDATPKTVEHLEGVQKEIDGRMYRFDDDGSMITGVFDTGTELCDYGENGALRAVYEKKGFVPLQGGTVYYSDAGEIVKGVVNAADGRYYYTGKHDGYLKKGYFEDDGESYFSLTADDIKNDKKAGELQSGWQFANGEWRLFGGADAIKPFAELTSSSSGHWIQTKDLTSPKRYFRKPGGKLLSGWQTIDGDRYYFDKDGSVMTGLQKISGKYYYFGETVAWDMDASEPLAGDDFGKMQKGRVTYGEGAEHTNFFNSSGVRQTGWQKYDDGTGVKWDFFDVNTAESLGATPVAGKIGWYEINRAGDIARYCFKDNSKLLTGWQTLDNGKYWFDTAADANGVKGRMAVGITTIGSSRYYFREKDDAYKGVLLTGYNQAEDAGETMRQYFADSKGVLKLGWQKPDGDTYKFFDYKLGYELENAYDAGDHWTVIEETVGGIPHFYKYYFKKGTTPATGLQEIGGEKYFFGKTKNSDSYGRLQSGLIKDGKTVYYAVPLNDADRDAVAADGAGQLQTGWINGDDGNKYYANNKCVLQKDWQTIGDKKYYFDTTTFAMKKGVQKLGKNTYVLDDTDGHMLTGYAASGEAHYYTDKKTGVMQYGWVNDNGTWRYFNADPASADYGKEVAHVEFFNFGDQGKFYKAAGRIIYVKNDKLQKNTQKIDGRTYYFDSNGILQTGEFLSGKTVYRTYTEEEATDPAVGHKEYTGSARSGLATDPDGKRYYDSKGKRITGWTTIEKNTYYYFDPETGLLKTGRFSVGKNTYFCDDDGKRQTGFVDGSYFDSKGVMRTGWQTVGGQKYYIDPVAGAVLKGFQNIGKKMYYLDPADGHMLKGVIKSGGEIKYYTKSNGEIRTGWQTVDDGGAYEWMYFDTETGERVTSADMELVGPVEIGKVKWYTANKLPDGNKTVRAKFAFVNNKPLTGWQTIDGRKYFFDDNGRLATGFWIINKNRYYFTEASSDVDTTLEGTMLKDGINNVAGRYYYMQSSGACRKGWFKTSAGKYYGDPETGELATGFAKLNDDIYYFSDQTATIGVMQTGFIKIPARGQVYYDDSEGASNMYYADPEGVIVTSGWRNIKLAPKVSDSQEWSYYFAPNRPHKDLGDFTLTGELAVGDVLIDDDGNISAYLDDGLGGNDGFAAGAATMIDEDGVCTPGSVTALDISRYYRFNSNTGARRKKVLYFYGNYYGRPIDDNQMATISSIRKYVDSGMEFATESADFTIVNASASFPMCASSMVADERASYVGTNDLNHDDHVDVLDVEIYSKNYYNNAITQYGPKNLVLAGASSGAGICLGLYKYALGLGSTNKLPAQVLLLSPWLDVGMSSSKSRNLTKKQVGPTDVATLEYWGARYTRDGNYTDEKGVKPYAGCASEDGTAYAFASPARYDGSVMENVIMYSGTYDPCYYDCEEFANKANKAAGHTVMKLNKYTREQHGFMFFSNSSATRKVVLDFCRNIMTE